MNAINTQKIQDTIEVNQKLQVKVNQNGLILLATGFLNEDVILVLCKNGSEYVTWKFTVCGFHAGHYFSALTKAQADFIQRLEWVTGGNV